MADLQAFYLALTNEYKQYFLQSLHAALQSPLNPVFGIEKLRSMMTEMARNTDMQGLICKNAIRATKGLAGFTKSDLNSYLNSYRLVVLPTVLPIEGASAQLSNAEQGSSLSLADNLTVGSQETVSPLGSVEGLATHSSFTVEDVSVENRQMGGAVDILAEVFFCVDQISTDESSKTSQKSVTTNDLQEDIDGLGGCPMPPVLDAESEDT